MKINCQSPGTTVITYGYAYTVYLLVLSPPIPIVRYLFLLDLQKMNIPVMDWLPGFMSQLL